MYVAGLTHDVESPHHTIFIENVYITGPIQSWKYMTSGRAVPFYSDKKPFPNFYIFPSLILFIYEIACI